LAKVYPEAFMLKGFGQFIMRGNVIDLAVAVVIGAAFGAIVTALVKDLLTPLIAAIFGKPDFSGLIFTVNGSAFHYGDFLNACLSFVFIAAAIYFFVVAPMNAISARFQKPGEPTAKACPECLSDIPFGATRCKYCTAQQPAVSA